MVTTRTQSSWFRFWLLPVLLLGPVPVLVFVALYMLDLALLGIDANSAVQHYLALDPEYLTDAISQLAPVVAALLGIVVTVVAIIVQLAAGRYPGVTRRFLRDPVNRTVLGYFVCICLLGLWLSVSLHADFVARLTLLFVLGAASLGLALILPYFAYVFRFLEPANLVELTGRDGARIVRQATGNATDERRDLLQAELLNTLAELTDTARAAITARDKIIASRSIDAQMHFLRDYLSLRDQTPLQWRRIGSSVAANPDFVAMDSLSLGELEDSGLWVEWLVLRQYLGIYAEALNALPDIHYLIAIDTRYIAEAAAERNDRALIRLALRFFNSYLRATLNSRNVRAAYNVLNQYRLLLESLLAANQGALVLEGIGYIGYYGRLGHDLSMSFILETAAYDTAQLCQVAHDMGAPEELPMLSNFLELDRPAPLRNEDQEPLGVRKAQAKLAAYYLQGGAIERARMIADDMRDEPARRLHRIQHELEQQQTREFWEITDRGHSFEYMPPQQRAHLGRFFELLGEARLTT